MAVPGSPPERRRPRRGSVERPVNGRLYRGGWLVVLLPLLVAAFSVTRPAVLPAPQLPPVFDGTHALSVARELARLYPDRSPGSPGARGAAAWMTQQLSALGLRPQVDSWRDELPGGARVTLRNVVAVVRGRSPDAIVLVAHRDDDGRGPGANDNASGTAALLELARAYGPTAVGAAPVTPAHTIVFVSTDGAVAGAAGAYRLARDRLLRANAVAVVDLDALAGHGPARLELAADEARSPAGVLVATASARVGAQTGRRPDRPSVVAQLVDLAFPFGLYEQAPLVGRGISAVTVTTGRARPPASTTDLPQSLDATHLAQLGAAAQSLLESLDQGVEVAAGTSSYVYLGTRIVHGWAIELVLIAALVPFALGVVDLFAWCRRRRIALAPAWRSLRSRVGFWLWVGVVFEAFRALGWWPAAPARPLDPASRIAGDWPLGVLLGFLLLSLVGWLVARHRLAPRGPVGGEAALAGQTVALVALLAVSVLVIAVNPFALLLVLPSLHFWLWLPQVRAGNALARTLVLLGGWAGPVLLLGSFAVRYGLGLDAPWYLFELAACGYLGTPSVIVGLCWLAVGAQLAALATGRYAPYPRPSDRGLGPVRSAVRWAILAGRSARRASGRPPRALQG